MTRAVLCLLLAAATVRAEEIVVRVAHGEEPVPNAGASVLEPGAEIVFDVALWKPDVLTDARGEAVVDVATEGKVLVYVAGFELAVLAPKNPLDVLLRSERVFGGTVVDSAGKPIPAASVTLKTIFRREATFRTRTDEKGRFHCFGLWFDDYRLWIAAAGFDSVVENVNERSHGRAFRLLRPGSVAGTVVNAAGEPVPGVRVGLGKDVTTAADGTFAIVGVPPGAHVLHVDEPYAAVPRTIMVAEGAVLEHEEILVLEPAVVRFRFVDEEGEPLAGVALHDESEVSGGDGRITLSVAPGRPRHFDFSVDGRKPGEVTVPALAGNGELDLGDLVLPQRPEVTLLVRTPDGRPATEGSVGDREIREGAVEGLHPGPYAIEVPGYPETWVRVMAPGPVVATLPEPRWLEGVVLDPDGQPVAGARVECGPNPYTTQADGRFRVGPLADGEEEITAEKEPFELAYLHVTVGDGDLELRLGPAPRPRLVRGVVLRGDEAVPRFRIGERAFVDEDGRFEVAVGAAQESLTVDVEGRSYVRRVPPEGETLVLRLPDTHVLVLLEQEAESIWMAGAWNESAEVENGTARFDGLEPGAYVVRALFHRDADIIVREGESQVVHLEAAPAVQLRLRLRDSMNGRELPELEEREGGWLEGALPRGEYPVDPRGKNWIRVGGERMVIDLAPASGGSLVGRSAWGVEIVGRLPNAQLHLYVSRDDDDSFRVESLPTGAYVVESGPYRREVEVAPGREVTVDLSGEVYDLVGEVWRADGRPAQGAEVWVEPGWPERTDPGGRFRIRSLAPGEHECIAVLDGYGGARATVTVGPSAADVRLVVQPRGDAVLALVGLAGEPLPWAAVTVDGVPAGTDTLGRVKLGPLPSAVDVELPGYASVHGLEVHGSRPLRLERAATLVVRAEGAVSVRVNGLEWPRRERRFLEEDLVLDDLPAGVVEVTEGEDGEPVLVLVRSGAETVLDLRGE